MSVIDLSKEIGIGVDIGGTNTKYGLVNHRGEILEKGNIKTRVETLCEIVIGGRQ